jgi:hypothetical protein
MILYSIPPGFVCGVYEGAGQPIIILKNVVYKG